MELAALITLWQSIFSMLPSAELPEVLRGLGGDVGEELHLDAAGGDGPDGHVEEHHGVLRVRRPLVPLNRRRRRRRRCRPRRDGRSAGRHCGARWAAAGSLTQV